MSKADEEFEINPSILCPKCQTLFHKPSPYKSSREEDLAPFSADAARQVALTLQNRPISLYLLKIHETTMEYSPEEPNVLRLKVFGFGTFRLDVTLESIEE